MKKTTPYAVFLLLCVTSLCAQAVLPAAVLQKIGSSVFEVVVAKPKTDSLTYEKPLPFDRLPYMERVDKYNSIGTAFLLDDGLFYSAAHVFQLTVETMNSDYYIRDASGEVFALDSFVKFSTARDFVVFTVKGFIPEKNAGLEAQLQTGLNTVVYAAGNALGEGIVIRSGILTSQTFESENGEWKWLRFSAAASPGNSGGPLITEEGRVIGIVTMKNQNENLNYALPISEISRVPDGRGIVHRRVLYSFPNILSEKKYGVFDFEVDLPGPYAQVCGELVGAFKSWVKEFAREFKNDYVFSGGKSFNRAEGYAEIMSESFAPAFPGFAVLGDDNKWSMQYPGEANLKESKLPQNGSVTYGSMLGYTLARITKPESMKLAELITSPKTYMDYILSASRLYRYMGGERIAITSFGNPVKTETYLDYFGRTWLVSFWNIEFADVMAISYALPIPEGALVIFKTDSTDNILNGINIDLAFMSDHLYAGYLAPVKDWKEFLTLGKFYPLYEPFASLKFEVSTTETALYSASCSLTLPQDIMRIDDKTRLAVPFGYAEKNGTLVQEVRGFDFYYRPVTEDYKSVSLRMRVKPPEGQSRALSERWDLIEKRQYPFNAIPYDQDEFTLYDEVLGSDESPLYVLSLRLHGKSRAAEMRDFAAKIKQSQGGARKRQ